MWEVKNKSIIHRIYHTLNEAIRVVCGENTQYRFIYALRTRKWLNLKAPKDLNEKLFWLARYWRNPLVVQCADKYRVREYLQSKGCGDILNELYGVYEDANDINFDTLPNKFALKCNHGSGMNIVCEDKSKLNIQECIIKLNEWLKFQFGRGVEWQYKPIKRKIIAEKYLEGKMIEYQVWCFNGRPIMFLVRNDLRCDTTDVREQSYAITYTPDWKRVYYRKNEENFQIDLPRPLNYQKMLDYAIRLSADFPQVRVDFYEVDGTLIFGEMTFSSNGNILSNYKPEILIKLGGQLVLPEPINKKHNNGNC